MMYKDKAQGDNPTPLQPALWLTIYYIPQTITNMKGYFSAMKQVADLLIN